MPAKTYAYPVASQNALKRQYNRLLDVRNERDFDTAELVDLNHPSFIYPDEYLSEDSTPVTREHLEAFRREVASTLHADTTRARTLYGADSVVSTVIFENLKMNPRQMEDSDVWATLALFVFPDYTLHRWGNAGNLADRIWTKRRNAIYRLWARRATIDPDLEIEHRFLLSQDVVSGIIERESFVGERQLVRAIILALAEVRKYYKIERAFYRNFYRSVYAQWKDGKLDRLSQADLQARLSDLALRFAEEQNLPRAGLDRK